MPLVSHTLDLARNAYTRRFEIRHKKTSGPEQNEMGKIIESMVSARKHDYDVECAAG